MPIDLSIIITCYNKESYLDECVSSVLEQTKKEREIIIVHDGCDQPSHHSKATSLFLKQNYGVSHARNEGARFSKGALLLFVDGDDKLSPDYVEKMWRVICVKGDIVYPDIYFWSQVGGSKLSILTDKIEPSFLYKYEKSLPISCMMKREVFEKSKGFRDLPVFEDLDFWVKAMCNDYTFEKANTLLWYRQIPGSRNKFDYARKKEIMKELLEPLKRKEGYGKDRRSKAL